MFHVEGGRILDGDRDLALRPEGTAGVCRAYLEHGLGGRGRIHRLWYMGPMFRHERPQKGRYRQFHQFDCEALGFAGPDIDVELLVMVHRLWQRLGLTDITLELNTIGSADERRAFRDGHDLDKFAGDASITERQQLMTCPNNAWFPKPGNCVPIQTVPVKLVRTIVAVRDQKQAAGG